MPPYLNIDRSRRTITKSGRACQPWHEDRPHRHGHYDQGRHNECRNPDGSSGPWCLTGDPGMYAEPCFKTCDECNYVQTAGVQLHSALQCTACHVIVATIRSAINFGSKTAKDYLKAYCNDLIIFAPFCKSMIVGPLDQIVKALKNGTTADSICSDLLHACRAQQIQLFKTVKTMQCKSVHTAYASDLLQLAIHPTNEDADVRPRYLEINLGAPVSKTQIVGNVETLDPLLETNFAIADIATQFAGNSEEELEWLMVMRMVMRQITVQQKNLNGLVDFLIEYALPVQKSP